MLQTNVNTTRRGFEVSKIISGNHSALRWSCRLLPFSCNEFSLYPFRTLSSSQFIGSPVSSVPFLFQSASFFIVHL